MLSDVSIITSDHMRSSMGKERLAILIALLHIHYEQQINVESVIDMFASFHPRRMEMESLMESQS